MTITLRQELKQSLKQELKLVASPQLRLFLKLLQKPQLELIEYIRQELNENPVLDEEQFEEVALSPREKKAEEEVQDNGGIIDKFDTGRFIEYHQMMRYPESSIAEKREDEPPLVETTVSEKIGLKDHLVWQLRLSETDEQALSVGEYIIGNLDDNGFLSGITLEEIAKETESSIAFVEHIRKRIMAFDPVGCAAFDLQESLLVQAKTFMPDNHKLHKLIKDHFKDLTEGKREKIERGLNIGREELQELLAAFKQLDPHPGSNYTSEPITYVQPDVYIYKEEDGYRVVVNDDGLPKLKILGYYEKILDSKTTSKEEKEFIRQKIKKALEVIRAIEQRQNTLKQITESIVRFQKEFFEKGERYLKPLRQTDVAMDIGVHESTVSRATANKYVYTPRGIFPFKYFFNKSAGGSSGSDMSTKAVQDIIKQLIDNEDPKSPLTDEDIKLKLKEMGIDVARRTIAKYRTKLGIPSSSKRKKLKDLF